jgi:pilus assembly protein CpaB
MKLRAIIMLSLALILGLASVLLARSWLAGQQPAKAEATAAPTQVVVASSGLEFGTRLNRLSLREVPWPAGSVPAGSFSKIDDLVGSGQERIVLRSIEANEPVLDSKLTAPGERATLSTVLPKDKRAITIRVNDVLGVAGFVLPGDRVDVLLTRTNPGESMSSSTTNVMLQSIRVLGVDQEANDRKDKPTVAKAVTLEVSPDEAQMLTLGAQVGSLSLALRNHADETAVASRTITLADLTSGPAKPAAAPAVAKPHPHRPVADLGEISVQVLRGIESTTTQVRHE